MRLLPCAREGEIVAQCPKIPPSTPSRRLMGDCEKMVADIEKVEQGLGVYDLAQLPPKP